MTIKNENYIPEGIEKTLEAQSRMMEPLQPLLEEQRRIETMTARLNLDSPHMRIGNQVMEAFKAAQNPALQFAARQASEIQATSGIQAALEAINQINYSFLENAIKAANKLSEAFRSTISPAIQWLESIDYNPIIKYLQNLDFDVDISKRYKELNGAYLQAMYDCHWFPYAGWTIDIRLFSEINDILATSRGASKRREKRIDKAIFSHYTDVEIQNIKRTWKKSDDIEPHIKRMLGQAINAHLRGEYALTITCLATLWEGLIHRKCNIEGRRNCKRTKQDFKELIIDNKFEPIFSDFYENMIVSQCDTPEEVIEGVPNRNGISHSKYIKYPNKKASLNAILLTDFIIGLSPINILEDQ